jgi:amidophosphoribosyltransferase
MRDGPRDECGVAAIVLKKEDAAPLTYLSLFALQHRGQEAAGISSIDGEDLLTIKDTGLVSQVFDKKAIRSLPGNKSIGHVRYSTQGGGSWKNAQPIWRNDVREVAIAHNGNLINGNDLRQELEKEGLRMHGDSDSEVIAALLSSRGSDGKGWLFLETAKIMEKLKGAYSTVALSRDEVVAFRDPAGVRPLVIGEMEDGYAVVSETCALDILGASFVREVTPGECISIRHDSIQSEQVLPTKRFSCLFEYIYFARPDTVLQGKSVQKVRGRMGEMLAEESPVDADIVIPVPDSGNPAASGFSRYSGIPRDEGLVKNRYVARTFIQPKNIDRKKDIRLKFNPVPAVVSGKRIVVVDDSIVRGNTTKKIVEALREAGASEVHLRVSSPPIKHPCFYGIDMSTEEEMIAHARSEDEIARIVGADSLAYLSLAGVYRSLEESPATFCDACFTGNYPLGKPVL